MGKGTKTKNRKTKKGPKQKYNAYRKTAPCLIQHQSLAIQSNIDQSFYYVDIELVHKQKASTYQSTIVNPERACLFHHNKVISFSVQPSQ